VKGSERSYQVIDRLKSRNWTVWERYLPSAKAGTRTGVVALCLQPWDHMLPEEGAEERMASTEPLWRTWERYLHPEEAAAIPMSGEGLEKVRV
jgi:hypothetical protein